jgi:hypothetical protein
VIKRINETGTVSVKKSLINPPNRKRLINFRVSEEELGFLVDCANRSGYRSVSEFIRQRAINGLGPAPVMVEQAPQNATALPAEHVIHLLRAVESALRTATAKTTA